MSTLRDVALILLALEGILLSLVVAALLAVINYGLVRSRWWDVLPRWSALARGYLDLAQSVTKRACRAVVAPILAVSAAQAALARWRQGLVGKERRTD